jgi:hypothetical protein
MAYGAALTTDISTYIQTVYDDAMDVLRENNLAPALVKGFGDLQSTAVRTGKDYSASTINSIGEDDDLAAQKWHPSDGQSLTPGEIGAQFFLTDPRLASDPEDLRNDAANELGMAGAEKIDTDIFGNINLLTGGTIGASGSANTWAYFYAMMTAMRRNKVPKPWVYVCTGAQWHPLGTALAQGGGALQVTGSLAESVVGDFYLGRQAGVEIFISENLETSSNDAYAGMWNPLAMALDVRRAPRIEPERDASRRGIELNFTAMYAHGIWKPTYGVQGLFLNTAPDGT